MAATELMQASGSTAGSGTRWGWGRRGREHLSWLRLRFVAAAAHQTNMMIMLTVVHAQDDSSSGAAARIFSRLIGAALERPPRNFLNVLKSFEKLLIIAL